MPSNQHHPYQIAAGWVLLVLAVPLLWWVTPPVPQLEGITERFLFWHTGLETFAVVVAILVFVTGHRAILSARKGAVVMLGVAFLGVGLLDFLHTMAYTGMPDAITANTPQKSVVFWLVARMLVDATAITELLRDGGVGQEMQIDDSAGSSVSSWPDADTIFQQ